MKNILAVISLFFIVTMGFGQTIGQNFVSKFFNGSGTLTNSLIFDNGTNVGIGMTSPGTKLDVNGTTRIGDGSNMVDIGQVGGTFRIQGRTANSITMWTNDVERLRIDGTSGNVGIGTTSPSQKLHIYSSVAEDTYFQIQNGNAGRTLKMGIPTGSGYALIENQAWNNTYQPISLSPNGGYVGIGTIIPSSVLHINSLNSSITKFTRAGANTYGFEIGGSTFGLYDYSNSVYRWRVSGVDLFLNETVGAVNIGTLPGAPVMQYKLNVGGSIRANEVVVNTTGADFVFDDAYNLIPLDEVEKFVKINKHLPEIPSAEEMKKIGVSVGELQTKLLQKVEELTLYMIKLDKENSELKQELKTLKAIIQN